MDLLCIVSVAITRGGEHVVEQDWWLGCTPCRTTYLNWPDCAPVQVYGGGRLAGGMRFVSLQTLRRTVESVISRNRSNQLNFLPTSKAYRRPVGADDDDLDLQIRLRHGRTVCSVFGRVGAFTASGCPLNQRNASWNAFLAIPAARGTKAHPTSRFQTLTVSSLAAGQSQCLCSIILGRQGVHAAGSRLSYQRRTVKGEQLERDNGRKHQVWAKGNVMEWNNCISAHYICLDIFVTNLQTYDGRVSSVTILHGLRDAPI